MDEKSNNLEDSASHPSKIDAKVSKDLTVSVTPNPVGKYIPPNQRTNQTPRDRITRSLKGLLNRLSEANMNSISKQVLSCKLRLLLQFIHGLINELSSCSIHRSKSCTWKTVVMKLTSACWNYCTLP